MKENEFKPLLEAQLSDAYCMECESKKILPKLQEAATDANLERTLEAQLITSNSNIEQLEKVCLLAEMDVTIDDCDDLKVVVGKAKQYLDKGPVNDAGILSHIERINNYKSAIYNSAVRFAKEVNHPSIHSELQILANHTYNIIDRLGRLNNDQSDERAIRNL